MTDFKLKEKAVQQEKDEIIRLELELEKINNRDLVLLNENRRYCDEQI